MGIDVAEGLRVGRFPFDQRLPVPPPCDPRGIAQAGVNDPPGVNVPRDFLLEF